MAQILTATIHVRVTPEEKEHFQEAANSAAQSLGEWVRKALLVAAQPTKPSEPGEGVLRMEHGHHIAVIPDLPAVPVPLPEIIDAIVPERFNNPLPPQLTVTALPTPPAPVIEVVSVVTPVKPMSMVDRMYASIEAREGPEAAKFWLATNMKRK